MLDTAISSSAGIDIEMMGAPEPAALDSIVSEDSEDKNIIQRTTLVFTARNCTKEADEFMIECNKCKFAIHFACRQLTAYQLSMIITKGYKLCMQVLLWRG